MKFTTIGYSTEDLQVFQKSTVDFSEFAEHERAAIIHEGFEYCNKEFDAKAALVLLKNDGMEMFDENDDAEDYVNKLTTGVDEAMKIVDNGNVVAFSWAVEYDNNVMVIENTTFEELVDFFKKEADKLEAEQE